MENENIPLYFYENEMSRQERNVKRLWITIVILILALAACNIAWVCYTAHTDISQDGSGINVVGDSNEVSDNGTESQNQAQN